MAQTIIGVNDPKAVRRYSAFLAVDVARTAYFQRKFMGVGAQAQAPIQLLTNLENDAGDKITFDLSMQLRMQPVEGEDTLENKEEALRMYTDEVFIDQARGGVNTGGRMTRKRTIHDLRKVARARQSEWWSRVFDELMFLYLSGGFRTSGSGAATFANSDYVYPNGYAGFAQNPFFAPDPDHYLTPGGVAFSSLTSGSKMTLSVIDAAVARAETMGGGTSSIPAIEPIMIEGEEHYVLIMHPWQEYDVRTNTSAGQWLDIQKAAAGAEGRKSPIFTGGAGMYNNVVLHKTRAVLRRNDAGSGGNVPAARALFLGRQAGVVAFGSPGTGLRYAWHEETRDNADKVVITTSSIFGIKKVRFDIDGVGRDFGVISIDTAAANPAP